jgi:hypothetical protein
MPAPPFQFAMNCAFGKLACVHELGEFERCLVEPIVKGRERLATDRHLAVLETQHWSLTLDKPK